jgi:hypothetical protein
MILRRVAAIPEGIRIYTFSVFLGVARAVNDCTTVISYNTRQPRYPMLVPTTSR